MSFLDFIEEELQEKLDPFVLFDEISILTSKPQRLIITAFLKKFEPLPFYDSSSYRLYTYDSIKGLSEIDSFQDKENCTNFLKMVVDGYDRVIFCDDYDVTKELWGLVHKESGFDYKDSFGQYIPQTQFYFKRSDIKSFLEYSGIPLPPCITKDVTINQADNQNEKALNSCEKMNQDNRELLQRIEQLEQELIEQKKINDDYVEVPFYESQEAFFEAYKHGKISSPSKDNEKLAAENNQLKSDNKKLTHQLDEAKKELDELKINNIQNLNDQPKKESQKTINAQSKFIKALLYIQYGVDVANNPRPHIENVSGEIKKDFETQGLSRELPSYLTVKKWVDSVELDIDS